MVASGEVYHLRSHPTWDQWLAVACFPLGALSAGLLFGLYVARQFSGQSTVAGFAWLAAAAFLALALLATWLRSTRSRPASPEDRFTRQLIFGRYVWLLVLRVAAVASALALIVIGGDAAFFAWMPAFVGELADRILFFKATVPVTLRSRTGIPPHTSKFFTAAKREVRIVGQPRR
jgi:DMSO reductase anchor subunit